MSQSADPVLDGVSFRCNPNRCKFRQMQVQTDSDRFRQVHSTKLHKYGDEREADRQTGRQADKQRIQSADSDSRFRQTAAVSQQTADAGSTYSDSRRTYSGRQ
ncbi:hypothetical protein Tco_0565457 [Tanacetum coccineum]